VQARTNEVIDIARANIDHALERGEKLDRLEDKAEGLTNSAKQFKKNAVSTRRQ
jgi:hypothetical protein